MGLSDQHDNSPSPYSSQSTDPKVQQSMVNLLADMGVQPQTLQASLVIASQSTDTTPPTSTISTVSSTNISGGSNGNSQRHSDRCGRRCDWRRTSLDRWRKDWHPASGQVGSASMNWTYSFRGAGARNITDQIPRRRRQHQPRDTGYGRLVYGNAVLSGEPLQPQHDAAYCERPKAIEVGVKFTAANRV